MERHAVTAPDAPKALGAYSHAIAAGELVFASGQLPIDPASGAMIAGDIDVQVRQALRNLQAVLKSAGTDLAHVVKVTVFLADIANAKPANAAYAEFFPENPPARTTVGATLPGGAGVEIDAIAVRG